MKNALYKKRIIDDQIENNLKVMGAICVEGPKWCGKTWTSKFHSNSAFMIGDPAGNFQNKNLALTSPSLVLQGDNPRLIDEWQEVPQLWDAVRYKVDERGERGLFILTGSSTPNFKGVLHSGAGRIARLKMRPMTLFESGDSTGDVSLKDLCDGKIGEKLTGDVDLLKIVEFIIRGGWPGNIETAKENISLIPQQYLDAIVEDDIHRIDGVKRDKNKVYLLLRSLARNESTTATNKTLAKDIKAIDDEDIDTDTVSTYLNLFNRLFLTDNVDPFSSNIRSSVRLKVAQKRHFVDPSIPCALLRITPTMLINDLETLGFLFESLCIRDLKVYADAMNARLFHYQDYKNNEIDAVIELSDGNWCAFEIKLGAHQIDTAAENLCKIRDEIKADGGKIPSVLCVICGLSNAVYKRPDGVYVVPITALKN